MTTQQAIDAVSEIIRENGENGELEGILNRYRIAALNRLVRIANVVRTELGESGVNESQWPVC